MPITVKELRPICSAEITYCCYNVAIDEDKKTSIEQIPTCHFPDPSYDNYYVVFLDCVVEENFRNYSKMRLFITRDVHIGSAIRDHGPLNLEEW